MREYSKTKKESTVLFNEQRDLSWPLEETPTKCTYFPKDFLQSGSHTKSKNKTKEKTIKAADVLIIARSD